VSGYLILFEHRYSKILFFCVLSTHTFFRLVFTDWEDLSNRVTRDHVSPHFQTPQSSLKTPRCLSYSLRRKRFRGAGGKLRKSHFSIFLSSGNACYSGTYRISAVFSLFEKVVTHVFDIYYTFHSVSGSPFLRCYFRGGGGWGVFPITAHDILKYLPVLQDIIWR